MDNLKLFDAEYKLMCLIWAHEPINSTELKNLCEKHLSWKKSTTYSMIKRLRERNILKNENATITSLVSKEEVHLYESKQLLEKNFEGSLPSFVSTFLKDRTLSAQEIKELMNIIKGE